MRAFFKRVKMAWRILRGKTGVVTVSAVLIHADGSKEDLGALAQGPVEYTPEAN